MTTQRHRKTLNRIVEHLELMKMCGETHDSATAKEIQSLKKAFAKPRRRPAPKPVDAGPLEAIAKKIATCTLCELCKARTQTVPGQGNPRPELMFIGEAPGADEDAQGLAFVGRSGQVLTKMIEAMTFTREEVFIGNIIKCRPPGNRKPTRTEMDACLPFLVAQIALLQPKAIVCLGATATSGLFRDIPQKDLGQARGVWHSYCGIDTMPTYHPAYILRDPSKKKFLWEDLQKVMVRLGRKPQ